MKILVTIARILVGSLFILSGLIKANDTLGFSYKLNEYFAPDVLNMEFLIPYTLFLSALICIVEVVLGFATLLGGKMKITSWILLLMIIFFTFLTFYSAYFNKVTSCGCFGDALKLTPWESFYKDIFLLVFIIIIFIYRKRIPYNSLTEDRIILPIATFLIVLASVMVFKWNFPWIYTLSLIVVVMLLKWMLKSGEASQWIVAGLVTVVTTSFCYYTYQHLPIRDFRPYAVGKNIAEGMKSAEELGLTPPQYAYDYTLKNSVSGDTKVLSSEEYMSTKIWEDTTWQITESSEPYKIKEGYEAPIHDFSISDADGNDITQEVLNTAGYYFVVVAYDIAKSDENIQVKLNDFYKKATADGHKVIGLTASGYEEVQNFKHKHQSFVEYYTTDGITLKTIIRSNPGLVLMKGPVVKAKYHYNDFPEYNAIKTQYLK